MKPMFHSKRLILGTMLAALFMTAAVRAEGPLPQCHVLAVGVENYTHQSQLPGCANDAKYLMNRFALQEGKLFSKVNKNILVNSQASRKAILEGMNKLSKQGSRGDWYVLIASGHNSGTGQNWGFMSQDELQIPGMTVVDFADKLAGQGKKVVIIMDCCFSGQLRLMAQNALLKHADPSRGGIVLMTACTPGQTSLCYPTKGCSAFSKSIDEAMSGKADFNGDGVVTLQELRRYVTWRVHDFNNSVELKRKHDGEIDYSLSFSDSLALAKVQPMVLNVKSTLTREDSKDTERKECHCKIFTVTLEKGASYTIDMSSTAIDSYLRLVDMTGKELQHNDDGGNFHDARIIITPAKTGPFKIIATTYGPSTGEFTLQVRKN